VTAIPERLAAACRGSAARSAWLARLPDAIATLQNRWRLSLGQAFDGSEGSCAWVVSVVRDDGSRAVLKLGLPHMEAAHEIDGLRFWAGDPTVRLLAADEELNAMLLESCEPGVALRGRPETEQDVVLASLLRRLWRRPPAPHPFLALADMIAVWGNETRAASSQWSDATLVRDGLELLAQLSRPSGEDVLLATDLHAGNVLSAGREPWLVIDPKPFVGDRAYDATQHLLNCKARVLKDPVGTIRRFADLLELDGERIRLWTFARSAAEPRETWGADSFAIAKALV